MNSTLLLMLVMSTVVPEPKPIEMPELHSIRTGLYYDGREYCTMEVELDGVLFPGDCAITSIGEF